MRLIQSRLTVTLAVVLASGCASGMQESEPVRIRLESSKKAKPAARTFGPPATYTGRLPCADCPGIQLTLTLLSDSTFRLRQAYRERPTVVHQLGRWSVDSAHPAHSSGSGSQLSLPDRRRGLASSTRQSGQPGAVAVELHACPGSEGGPDP